MDTGTAGHTRKLLGGIFQQLIKNGGGMVVSLTLAIFVTPEELGAFAIVIAIHGFFNLMHAAFLAEPLTLFAGREFHARQAAYFSALERVQLWAGLGVAAVLSLSAILAELAGAQALIVSALWVIAPIQPIALWSNYLERRLYLDLRADLAIRGSAVQLGSVTAAIIAIAQFGLLNVPTALAILGGGYAICALIHGALLRRLRTPDAETASLSLGELADHHLAFGKWSALAHGLWWLVQNIYILANGIIVSLAAAGAFKILITLSNFGTLAMSAIGMSLMPMLVRAKTVDERTQLVRLGGVLVLLGGLGFALVFLTVAPWGVRTFFGEKFSIGWPAYILTAFYPFVAGLQFLTSTLARARGKPSASVYGTAIALIVTGPVGMALVVLLEVPGSMAAQGLTVLGVFIAISWLLRR